MTFLSGKTLQPKSCTFVFCNPPSYQVYNFYLYSLIHVHDIEYFRILTSGYFFKKLQSAAMLTLLITGGSNKKLTSSCLHSIFS